MQQISTINSVFKGAHERKYDKGQILLYQGEKTDKVFKVKSGFVKVYDVTSDGNEKLLLLLGPDDIFPLQWTFKSSGSLHYFYETIDDAVVTVAKRMAMINGVRKSHELALHLLEYFVERSNDLMNRVECIEAASAKHKVAQVPSYLAYAHGDEIAKNAYKVRVPTTHQMIANMAGLNRSTCSIYMKELETEKMYKDTANGGFIIHTDRLNVFMES